MAKLRGDSKVLVAESGIILPPVTTGHGCRNRGRFAPWIATETTSHLSGKRASEAAAVLGMLPSIGATHPAHASGSGRANCATDWGEQLELKTDIGPVNYMVFSAADGTACVGFRLYYGHKGEWARMRTTGAYCDAKVERLGEPAVQRIFDMVKFNKGESGLYQQFVK